MQKKSEINELLFDFVVKMAFKLFFYFKKS